MENLNNENRNLNRQSLPETPTQEYDQIQRIHPSERLRRFITEGLEPAIKKTVFPRTVARVIQQHQQQQESPYVLHPYSYLRIAWEGFIVIASLLTLVVIPISVAFYKSFDYFNWTISNVIFDVIFLGDIAVNFRTGYEDHIQFTIVMERQQIASRYLKMWFTFDLLSSLPLDMIYYSANKLIGTLSHVQISISKCLSMLRILRLVRLCRYVIKLESFMEISNIYLHILNLMIIVFLITHWVACIQFFVVTTQNYPNGSWVDMSNIEDSPIFVQYTHSMFKSLSQFISVGYGSITPIETSDIILTMLTCSLGSFFYATFIGFLSDIIMSVGSRRREFSHKIAGICEFLEYKNVPEHLQRRIMKYYKRCYPSHFFNEQEILRELSPSLRKELLLAAYKPLVQSVPFLAHLRTSILYRIVQHLKHDVFMAGEIILEEGTDSPGIFFVYRGVVDVLDKDLYFIRRMRSGYYFGDISILIEKPNSTNVIAQETTELYMLPRADFRAIVQRHPESFKTLFEDAKRRNKKLQATLLNATRLRQHSKSQDDEEVELGKNKPFHPVP